MLPLTISTPAVVTRAMVGRIELVSPAQQQALRVIANGPVSNPAWYRQFLKDHVGYLDGTRYVDRPGGSDLLQHLINDGERGIFARLKVPLPADYQAYLSLGRFRDALLWDAQRRTPDPELAGFLRTYVVSGPILESWQAAALGKDAKPSAATFPSDEFLMPGD